jgi:hypothetical protein
MGLKTFVLRDEFGYVRRHWDQEPPRDELLSEAGMSEILEYYRGSWGWETWPDGHDPDGEAGSENTAIC